MKKSLRFKLLSLLLCCMFLFGMIPSTSYAFTNHPVRVYKSADGWPHFFEVWESGAYVKKILTGYGNEWIGNPLSSVQSYIDSLANNKGNFFRLWMRPSDCIDGHYPYYYNTSTKKVDLDTWDEAWFDKLDDILAYAQSKKVVVELMMWDRCTGWKGDLGSGLTNPATAFQNVHHPDLHYRSSAGNQPIPGLYTGDEDRIGNSQWYDTSNTIWMNYQKAWMNKVMETAMNYDYITVEIINEAPIKAIATTWRQYMHDWFHSQYPTVLTQSNSLGQDDVMAQWGENNPGKIDMIATHSNWTYSVSESRYNTYKGIVPASNESGGDYSDLNVCRRLMWGLTMGGGVHYVENVPALNGSIVTNEMYRFFYPASDAPSFWEMKPIMSLVNSNDGTKYVLAKPDSSQILIFMDNNVGTGSFTVNATGTYKYRTFTVNGTSSSWSRWTTGQTSWSFKSRVNKAYQIVKIDETAPVSEACVSPAAPNGSNGWYTSDVTVSLSAIDDLSSVAKTEYQVNNGVWITYTGSIPAFGEGIYKVGYRSTDQAGNVELIKTIEFKIDKTAPLLTVQLDKTVIWPPNHIMVTIHATLNSSDATSGVASVVLTSITSNEPDSGQGDIQANFDTEATSFSLRAERSGQGSGRIYTITYTATDKAGNKKVISVTVTVPLDQ